MKTYRVNILGCRGRGTAAARAYHEHPRTEIVALCDLVEERLNTLGDEVGVSARFTDLDEMIRQTEPDIVAIPTGTEFHYDLCMRVLEHGVNIEVEKPMCVDLIQADAVIARAQEKGVRTAVHHQGRVGASMQAIGHAYKEGKIGELRYIYGSGKGYYGGYGLMNIGTHMINNMLRFGGRPRSVVTQATTDGHPITPDDIVPSPSGMGTIACEHITASLQFDNNVTGTLLQHRFDNMDSSAYAMELYGSEGRLMWRGDQAWWLPRPHFIPDGEHDRWEAIESIYPESYQPDGSAAEADYWFVEEYVRALDEGREHECSGLEGRRVLEVLMGVFESAAHGTRVNLPQENREHPLHHWRREAALNPPSEMPRPYWDWLSTEFERLGR